MKKNPIAPPPTVTLTIPQLINQRMRECNISRSQLVTSCGYPKNISNGCKKLDIYLKNPLNTPTNEFVPKLLFVLNIDEVTYSRALQVSLEKMNAEAKAKFRPYIEILINFNPTPCFAAQYVYGKCYLPIPEQILNFPFPEEISSITHLYQEYAATLPFHDRIIGFRYHREYEYFFKYDVDLILKKVEFTRVIHEKKLFGNRVFDMIIGQ